MLWVSGGNNFILDLISVVLVYNQIEHIAAKEPWGMVAVCTWIYTAAAKSFFLGLQNGSFKSFSRPILPLIHCLFFPCFRSRMNIDRREWDIVPCWTVFTSHIANLSAACIYSFIMWHLTCLTTPNIVPLFKKHERLSAPRMQAGCCNRLFLCVFTKYFKLMLWWRLGRFLSLYKYCVVWHKTRRYYQCGYTQNCYRVFSSFQSPQ